MKLYYKPGACSMASHIILNTIGANFNIEKVNDDMLFTESGADYARINPKAYVPLLELDDKTTLTENPAILTYLGQLKPEFHLLPEEKSEFYKVLETLSYISSELHGSFSPFFSGKQLNLEEERLAHQTLGFKLEHFNHLLSDGRQYLHGNTLYVCDIFLYVVANWANLLGFGLKQWPYVDTLVNKIAQMPAVQASQKAEGLSNETA